MKAILISIIVVVIVAIVIALVIAGRKPKEENGDPPKEGGSLTPPPIPKYMDSSFEQDEWEETGVLGSETDETDTLGMDAEETVILGDDEEETTILGSQRQKKATLTRLKNGETAVLEKSFFILGREHSEAGFCIPDNPRISRKHAEISYREGDYFLRDNHSTNGTFVNDQKVDSDQEVRLHSGDVIRLAEEGFQFHLL